MLSRISFLFAFNTLLLITTGVLMYHLAIVTEFIPYAHVWGGRIRTQDEMIRFESISLLVNALFLLVLYLKIRRYRAHEPAPWENALLWGFVLVFLLNTVVNLVSFSNLETLIFTPLTFLLAVFTTRVAMQK